ncbi:MAG: hypothetical protein VX836_06630 [Pseudomonadota bacterium]|nr:hypothetical protein [Pseudomonadota bacterium]
MNTQATIASVSVSQLLKATTAALIIAIVILVSIVLPAEYGIDPTGIGGRLGLTALAQADDPAAPEILLPPPVSTEAASATPVIVHAAPFQHEQMSVTLPPGKGAEIKAAMKSGDSFVFSWRSDGGVVSFDMHGDETNAAEDEFTSYWVDRSKPSGSGSFVAPFDGNHGWYWYNGADQPVTVTVEVSGYFEKLFRPGH